MATLTKTYMETRTEHTQATWKEKYNAFIKQLSFSYFGFISFTISISAILGGGVVKFSLENNAPFWQFVVGMILSLINIVVAVAQFPVKWVFTVFAITTLVNIGLVLFSFIF